ncbi:MAG: thiamine-phosphate kinase [Chitinophagales bacterium]|nr:thiamine-phosphate kinase [Chitinophagales bacterium]
MDKEAEKRTEIGRLGEFGLIKVLTAPFKAQQATTVKAIGDDAAVLAPEEGKQVLLSTDMLVEGIHFDLMYTPLKHLGYKAVVVNLSDIYAMNAVPQQVTVSLAISNRFSLEALEELYEGIRYACERYGVDLVGGDTTSSQKGLIMSITAIGYAQGQTVAYRNTAKPGDLICVSGDLGAAYLGLQLLEREKQLFLESSADFKPDLEDQKYCVGRQLKPEARRDIIAYLAEKGVKPTSMIDVSDGLSSDLLHLCTQSGTGAIIYEDSVPIHEEAYSLALKFNLDPITCALSGGEDYELLFTIAPDDRQKMMDAEDITIIGIMLEENQGINLLSKGGNLHPITAQGWDAIQRLGKP